MSDAPRLRPFVIEALTDLGAAVSEDDSLIWVQAPELVQRDLEVPGRFALAFDPERNREFEAELVAPGSYFLERLVSVVVRRGRWDVSHYTVTGAEVEPFRTRSLGLLEEEVRRIFGHFDRTIEGLRESDPGGSQDLLRAVMAERDRRLTEAVERFDPKASASLCSIRAILIPTARLAIEFPDGTRIESRLDAWSRRVRGLAW